MALSTATIKATIIAEVNAAYGPTADAATQDKFATALSEAFFKILTLQAQVIMAGGGVDTGGDSLVTNVGAIS
ncbi:MAG: hypothetical protein JRL30_29240 [Deltaproteobacteria bacterium]|nr:hypothetical protein [Deltaproteobacteria bacterium]